MPSNKPPSEDEQEFNGFVQEGLVSAIFNLVRTGCAKEGSWRLQDIDHLELASKVKGVKRSAMVEYEATMMAPVFGFKEVFVRTGITGFPKGMFLQRDKLLLSFHQSASPGLAPADADYRRPYAQRIALPPSLFGDQQRQVLELLISEEGFRHWAVTYQRTWSQLPTWITMGRPVLGQTRFGYHRDLAAALGQAELVQTIDMNPGMTAPAPTFKISPADKGKGEE